MYSHTMLAMPHLLEDPAVSVIHEYLIVGKESKGPLFTLGNKISFQR